MIITIAIITVSIFAVPNPEKQANPGSVPVGSIVAFYGDIQQIKYYSDWLICDGLELDSKKYPRLSSHLEVLGLDKRFLPDLRGQFLRAAVEANNSIPCMDKETFNENRKYFKQGIIVEEKGNRSSIGTKQESAIVQHSHKAPIGSKYLCVNPNGGGQLGSGNDFKNEESTGEVSSESASVRVSKETRPTNVAVHWIIKAR